MNGIFSAAFAAICLFSFMTDIPKRTRMSPGEKWVYGLLGLKAVVLFAAACIGAYVPMPAQFFVNYISPWVFSILPR
ncbi:hypothetical protein [Paenibacillus hamazuiensis]|uniref:hypothetical protein n=1 Tax=Paenibacillus hamazuiensis TaxID=2936508 RepID=UPI0020102578|nr:hypothetical protein [Paenibacillus hamazuiensis]